jgi:hypothetical protein
VHRVTLFRFEATSDTAESRLQKVNQNRADNIEKLTGIVFITYVIQVPINAQHKSALIVCLTNLRFVKREG